ncbi:MAG: tail fiber domain-containing protein [Patescibacteria group bacterium]|nr:tail fiber domain-containing protein [Patescibacteria group bacterium]
MRTKFGKIGILNRHRAGFGGGSQTTTSNSAPWSGQQGYLTNVFGQARNLYNNYTPQYYGYTNGTQTGGSTVAPMNAQETGAISAIGNTGLNGTSALNGANSAVSGILSGDPSYANSIAASVVPGLESQFALGNSMNNPAAAYSVSNGFGNAMLQNQLNAAETAPYIYNTQLGGQNAALTAGQAAQTQSQNELNNQVNAYNYYQQLPYTKLNDYSNLVNGMYGSTSSTSTPTQTLFGSLFSDRRLKKNIEEIGKTASGHKLYSFEYLWGEKAVGVMADEVEKVMPLAISNVFGFKAVNYDMVM